MSNSRQKAILTIHSGILQEIRGPIPDGQTSYAIVGWKKLKTLTKQLKTAKKAVQKRYCKSPLTFIQGLPWNAPRKKRSNEENAYMDLLTEHAYLIHTLPQRRDMILKTQRTPIGTKVATPLNGTKIEGVKNVARIMGLTATQKMILHQAADFMLNAEAFEPENRRGTHTGSRSYLPDQIETLKRSYKNGDSAEKAVKQIHGDIDGTTHDGHLTQRVELQFNRFKKSGLRRKT